MRRYLVRLVLAGTILAAPYVNANTAATDVSDLWWNASESGWGVNLIHQNEILFATFFVYSSSGSPLWLVGDAISRRADEGSTFVYSGVIYQTTGPWFGSGAFNPANVGLRQVGTATFRFDSITSGRVDYTVDGVQVSKPITRNTFRVNNLAGTYIGAAIGTFSNCPLISGYFEEPGVMTVTQSATTLTLQFQGGDGFCTYTGPYSQSGRMGAANGSFTCSNGSSGQFSAYEIEGSTSAFVARAQFQSGTCSWIGRFGGLRGG